MPATLLLPIVEDTASALRLAVDKYILTASLHAHRKDAHATLPPISRADVSHSIEKVRNEC